MSNRISMNNRYSIEDPFSTRPRTSRFTETVRHRGYEMNHNESPGLRYDRGEVSRGVTEVVKTITTESLTTTREGRR